MASNNQRPPSSRARPGTASRPRTGTAAGGRPTTAQRNNGDNTAYINNHWPEEEYHQHDIHMEEDEDEDEEEEDDYESEDDGDVFAFVPPDIGPSATLTSNPTDPILDPAPPSTSASAALPSSSRGLTSAAGRRRPPGTATSNRTAVSTSGGRPPSAVAIPHGALGGALAEAEEDETFYYDEATGAVYDSQGRLVQMPSGFDPSAVMASTAEAAAVSGDTTLDTTQHSAGTVGAGVGAGAGSSALALDSIIHRTDAADSSNPYAASASIQPQNPLPSNASHSTTHQLTGSSAVAHPPGLLSDRSRKDSHRSSFGSLEGGYPAALRHAASINNVGMMASTDALSSAPPQGGPGAPVAATSGAAPRVSMSDSEGIRRRQNSVVRRSLQDPLSMATAYNAQEAQQVGVAFGGGDAPVGPGAQVTGGRLSTMSGGGMQQDPNNNNTGLNAPGKSSSENSDDSKMKMDGDMMLMMDNGDYYAYPHTLDPNDPKALDFPGYLGQDGSMMMHDYPLGMGNGLMHPVHEGSTVGPRGVRIVELEMETEEDSPYPEVRASVSNVDDPDMPVNTIRMWFLSFIFMTVAGGANQLFSLRFPAVYLTPVIVQLLSYPAGKLLAATMPIGIWTLPRWLGGASFSLNPGMFNIKEHTAIFIMANVATGPVYALNMIVVLDSPLYYNRPTTAGYQFLLSLTSQLFAFSFAGFVRRLLVYPASMIWPLNLVIATIFNTLHAEDDGEDGTMTRFRLLTISGVAAGVWYFFPGFIFTALSAFNFVCWIWPRSRMVNILFGTGSGLGMSLVTFDWSQIAFSGNPLVIPWWAQVNIFVGFVLIIWVVTPALYFTNTFNFAYLPISSSGAFDRFGGPYEVQAILGPDGATLDPAAYEAYSAVNLSTTFYLTFWTGFATASALFTHTVLYHGSAIVAGIRYGKVEEDDIHAKHMRVYPETPRWWYLAVLLVTFVVAVIVVEVYDTGLPVWGLLLSMMLPAIYILPAGFLYALTGQQFGLNLVSEFVAGYVFPGRTVPNMVFKVYAQTGLGAAANFLQDLKLGHYMKIPPRTTFIIQLVASIWCAIVQIGVKAWAFDNINDICGPMAQNRFYCPQARTFYTASIIFGVLGPDRLFGKGTAYGTMYWSILFGFLIPIPFWVLGKKYPKSVARWISWPIILTGSSFIPPATGINIASWFTAGFIFQYLLRKYNFRWWSKYNFVLAAGLDAGSIASALIIFLCLSLPKQGEIALNWWGNTVQYNTLDFNGTTWRDPPEEGFGQLPKA
ncbi:hypothetical protein A4X13_0g853 [Tilletia indica]|uniref:OPT family small oligopeptide transporter n=1 Tax=Tilletia indica TaxID=43049 RepID=A0A177TFL2_9BASI|nr:hypothetical protein A4X13_0g853 [Tilletia indica]